MNLFQKAVNNIKSGFASYTEVTNSASVEINPMLKSLEQMNYRPRFKSVDNLEYLELRMLG